MMCMQCQKRPVRPPVRLCWECGLPRPRSTVRRFAISMEQKLLENDHKGGWDTESWKYLADRLRDEVKELRAVLNGRSGHAAGAERRRMVTREAADVANFAMMIADIYGELPSEETP